MRIWINAISNYVIIDISFFVLRVAIKKEEINSVPNYCVIWIKQITIKQQSTNFANYFFSVFKVNLCVCTF